MIINHLTNSGKIGARLAEHENRTAGEHFGPPHQAVAG